MVVHKKYLFKHSQLNFNLHQLLPNINKYMSKLCYSLGKCSIIFRMDDDVKVAVVGNEIDILTDDHESISYDEAELLIYEIGSFILFLNNIGFAPYTIETSDILILNGHYFFIGFDKIYPILHDNIVLISPKPKNAYSSPEFFNNRRIPTHIHFSSCIYSFGVIICTKLFPKNINLDTLNSHSITNDNIEKIKNIIKPIEYTKVYWFLLRCLTNQPSQRKLLFI